MRKPAKEKKGQRMIRKLRDKYRLVIINDSSFDERISILLTPLNVITILGLAFFVVAAMAVSLIVFTPLKELIPGYSDTRMKRYAYEAAQTADSLEYVLFQHRQYLQDLKKVLTGNIQPDSSGWQPSSGGYSNLDYSSSEEEMQLRLRVESEELYSLAFDRQQVTRRSGMAGVFFFTPVRGVVLAAFDQKSGHFGVDIAGKTGEAVKAALDGTVVMASFTIDGGYVMQVQHEHNLISGYKHNSQLLRSVGDRVKAGDPIAIIGDTGELSDGPHLHFELWQAGVPLNPQEYIAFD